MLEDADDRNIDLLDMDSFLNRLDGNKDLAARMIGLFLDHYLEKQAAIYMAINNNDPKALNISAHTFKGMLLHFCKKGNDLAYQLENMGHSGKVDAEKAKVIYETLKIVTTQIVPKLKSYKCKFEG